METNMNNLSGAQFGGSMNANATVNGGGSPSFAPVSTPGTANPGMANAGGSVGVTMPSSGIGGSMS